MSDHILLKEKSMADGAYLHHYLKRNGKEKDRAKGLWGCVVQILYRFFLRSPGFACTLLPVTFKVFCLLETLHSVSPSSPQLRRAAQLSTARGVREFQ